MNSTDKGNSEEWKSVPGWEGLYEVSTIGRVRSIPKVVDDRGFPRKVPGRYLSLKPGNTGYSRVMLREGGRKWEIHVHRLMAMTFLPNPENHPVVRHLDDVKLNNSIDNLAWGTPGDNLADSIRNGRHNNQNRGKTQCKYGHGFDEANTGHTTDGKGRYCKACARRNVAESRTRIRSEGREPPAHGTSTAYSTYKCRCERCIAWSREYERTKREKE